LLSYSYVSNSFFSWYSRRSPQGIHLCSFDPFFTSKLNFFFSAWETNSVLVLLGYCYDTGCLYGDGRFGRALFSSRPLQKKHVQIMVLFENASHWWMLWPWQMHDPPSLIYEVNISSDGRLSFVMWPTTKTITRHKIAQEISYRGWIVGMGSVYLRKSFSASSARYL
jgi:hypothetical protein